MRILFCAKYVPTGRVPMGGVQSWIKTVRKEFEAMGHECVEWQPGFPARQGAFDLGIFAHWSLTRQHEPLCAKVINITHGIIEPERPSAAEDWVWAVSEGVRAHWRIPNAPIIRQPIDTEFWRPAAEPDRGPPLVVRWGYRQTPLKGQDLARTLGADYVHAASLSHEEGRRLLQKATLVLASGRAALEAMACGAPTLIYDHRKTYQGELFDPSLVHAIGQSYSGRGGFTPTVDELTRAAQAALQKPRPLWREWVLKHHDSAKIAREILE